MHWGGFPWFHSNDVASVVSRRRLRAPPEHRIKFCINTRHPEGENFVTVAAFIDYLVRQDLEAGTGLLQQYLSYLQRSGNTQLHAAVIALAQGSMVQPVIPTSKKHQHSPGTSPQQNNRQLSASMFNNATFTPPPMPISPNQVQNKLTLAPAVTPISPTLHSPPTSPNTCLPSLSSTASNSASSSGRSTPENSSPLMHSRQIQMPYQPMPAQHNFAVNMHSQMMPTGFHMQLVPQGLMPGWGVASSS